MPCLQITTGAPELQGGPHSLARFRLHKDHRTICPRQDASDGKYEMCRCDPQIPSIQYSEYSGLTDHEADRSERAASPGFSRKVRETIGESACVRLMWYP